MMNSCKEPVLRSDESRPLVLVIESTSPGFGTQRDMKVFNVSEDSELSEQDPLRGTRIRSEGLRDPFW
jgi:hypothetical protein